MTSTGTEHERLLASEEQHAGGVRKDIQALRALAVLGVVVYHLWPSVLPGGFVGVDVFFVISGFLITSHLLKSPPSGLRDLATFWSRRIIRLLPAVFVVVVATLVATILFLPSAQWARNAREAIASMFYVENWQLISDATDYLNAHRELSPFQHFWSLAVEEQYYIVWPILVGLLLWTQARTRSRRHRVFVLGFGSVVLASFVWSVVQTQSAPAVAYFSTLTRMWELGLGSLLAAVYPWAVVRLSGSQRTLLLWAGLAGVGASFFVLSAATPFPGWAALLPTLATVAIILANDPNHPLNPRLLLHSRPSQFFGDCSYALYLWHWPAIVLAPAVLGHGLGTQYKLAVLGFSVLAAWASTKFLEAPFRRSLFLRDRLRRPFIMAVVLSCTVLALGLALRLQVDRQITEDRQKVAAAGSNIDEARCLGAAAMDPGSGCTISGDALLTSPAYAKADISEGTRACLTYPPFPDSPIKCSRGDTENPTKRVALFGNSHAGQWTEALDKLGQENRWRVDTFVVGGCISAVVPQKPECNDMIGQAADLIVAGHYDAVVMATTDDDARHTPEIYKSTIATFTKSGAHVLVIRDIPAPWDPDNDPVDCVAANLTNVDACAGTPEKWILRDLLAQAAEQMASPDVTVVDLNAHMCTETICPEVIGGVIVHFDFNHLTRTFSRSLTPYLEPSLAAALR